MLSLSQSRSASIISDEEDNIDDNNNDIFTPITRAYSDTTIPLKHEQHEQSEQLSIYDMDPSVSQHAMNNLVAIHEAVSKQALTHPHAGTLTVTPSIGYSSDYSHNNNNLANNNSNIDDHDLHILSPLRIHLNSQKSQERISITISDDTVVTKPHSDMSHSMHSNQSNNDMSHMQRKYKNNKKKIAKYSRKKYHKRTQNRAHKKVLPQLQLQPTDTELYGGPKPYFVKQYPNNHGKRHSKSISPQQSLDSYCINVSDNEWFIYSENENEIDNNYQKYENCYRPKRQNNPFSVDDNNKPRNSKKKSNRVYQKNNKKITLRIKTDICNKYKRKHPKNAKYSMHQSMYINNNNNNNNNNYRNQQYHFVDDTVDQYDDAYSCNNSTVLY